MNELWYNYDLSNPRETTKCIKQLEKICRFSLEYDDWQRKCKYNDSTNCPICGDNYYDNNSKCESHHHPKTLYDIVEDILNDHLEKNDLDEQTGFQIVQEIMDLHLFNKVQYINLCQHCHKKYHAGHPEVKMKMDSIFEKRVQKERKKEVQEGQEEDLTISGGIKHEHQVVYPPVLQPKLVKNATSGVEPQMMNIETSKDFISIDIADL